MRKFAKITLLVFTIITTACGQEVKVVPAFTNLKFEQPVEFIEAPDGSKRVFVLEQKGTIKVFTKNESVKKADDFLNISKKVVSGGERGLLGLAFHPDFKNNGFFYLNYTTGSNLKTNISRFTIDKSKKNVADPNSEVVLLSYDQPYENHNGGKIAFGPDGFLYISAGDGGSGGDPHNYGQNLDQLLGKMIRVDVDKKDGNLNYAIPAENPFQDKGRKEIYAYGLRNVWKFSFDKKTGELWAGDVGQNEREEIHIIKEGGNYGWKIMEGMVCFKSDTCDVKGLNLPIYEYLHKDRLGQSITGGYVYRGKNISSLDGWYIYGDFTTGNIWRLKKDQNGKVENKLIHKISGAISSFGEDQDGEIYVCSYGDGKIYKLSE